MKKQQCSRPCYFRSISADLPGKPMPFSRRSAASALFDESHNLCHVVGVVPQKVTSLLPRFFCRLIHIQYLAALKILTLRKANKGWMFQIQNRYIDIPRKKWWATMAFASLHISWHRFASRFSKPCPCFETLEISVNLGFPLMRSFWGYAINDELVPL